jgi:drug/metabolite transporter (DMT)-like permease
VKPRLPPGILAWRIGFPFLLAAIAFAMHGLAFSALAFVFGVVVAVLVARYDTITPRLIRDRRDAKVHDELHRRFRRWWFVALGAGVLGTATAFIGGEPRAGDVALILAVGIAISGALALAVMRWTRRT